MGTQFRVCCQQTWRWDSSWVIQRLSWREEKGQLPTKPVICGIVPGEKRQKQWELAFTADGIWKPALQIQTKVSGFQHPSSHKTVCYTTSKSSYGQMAGWGSKAEITLVPEDMCITQYGRICTQDRVRTFFSCLRMSPPFLLQHQNVLICCFSLISALVIRFHNSSSCPVLCSPFLSA